MEILNDRVLAEDILENGFTYRKCIFKQLQSVIRYLYNQEWERSAIIQKCTELLTEFDKDNIRYTDIINVDGGVLENLYDDGIKISYKGDAFVYFSNKEMSYINELNSTRAQRMLFTVMALLKFQKLRLKKERNFISTPVADIMRFAGTVSASSKERRELWNEILTTQKAEIFVTQKGEDICYRPLYKPEEGEAYTVPVTNTLPFGEQWLILMRKDVFQCCDCGQWFPRSGLKKTLRCKDCNIKHRRNYIKLKVRDVRKKKKEEKIKDAN